jgi:hypothetical protein
MLALNRLRVSEAVGADIDALGMERGHRTLVVTRARRWRAGVAGVIARGGSGRLGAAAALVPDDGYRILLGEPGAGGECLVELAAAQPLADLGH